MKPCIKEWSPVPQSPVELNALHVEQTLGFSVANPACSPLSHAEPHTVRKQDITLSIVNDYFISLLRRIKVFVSSNKSVKKRLYNQYCT